MKSTHWLFVAVILLVIGIEEVRLYDLRQKLGAVAGSEAVQGRPAAGGPNASTGSSPGAPESRPPRESRASASIGEEPEGGGSEMGKTLRKMAENPVSRALMNTGIKAMASVWYGPLIEEFELSREEADYFMTLKAGLMAEQQQLGMKLMGAGNEEERRELQEEFEQLKEDHEKAVHEFLNDDEDIETYQAFEERLPEHQQMDGLRNSMAAAGAPLSPGQEGELVEALYRVRTAPGVSETNWEGASGMEAIASGDARERFEREWHASNQRVLDEVGGVLNEEQMDAFGSYRDQMLEMQLMGIEMAEKMFQSNGDGE